MTYTYIDGTNKLLSVDDAANMSYGTDFGRGGTTNYTYDKDGNLTSDIVEGIDSIKWTHDGKVVRVSRGGNDPRSPGKTNFQYDAMRQRVVKTDNPSDGDPTSQYYVRDAGGNTIAVYQLANEVNELPYGSEGGEFCFSITIECLNSHGSYSNTVEFCEDDFTYDPVTGDIDIDTFCLPICFTGSPPDTCCMPAFFTFNKDSIGKVMYGVSCIADVPLWVNYIEYNQPEESYQVLQLAEYNIYGSEGHGRFVTWKPDSVFADTVVDSYALYGTDSVYYHREKTQIPRIIGEKEYEVKDHLGNVRMTFTDQKVPIDVNSLLLGWELSLLTVNNYYPFGMQMPGMSWKEGDNYRYGFNSQQKDDDIYGTGNSTTAEFWQYDSRLGRRWNVDPKPNQSIGYYVSFADNPVLYSDPFGDTIRGNSNASAQREVNNIKSSFPGEEAAELRELFKLDQDGITISTIDEQAFKLAVNGLPESQQMLAVSYLSAINGDGLHLVEAIYRDEEMSTLAFASLHSYVKASGKGYDMSGLGLDIDCLFGGGVNFELNGTNSTYTVLLMDSRAEVPDFQDMNGNQIIRFSSPGELSAHEILGHGYGKLNQSPDAEFIEAIQLTNLYLRSTGESNVWRNGWAHGLSNKQPLDQKTATGIPQHYSGFLDYLRYQHYRNVIFNQNRIRNFLGRGGSYIAPIR